MTSLFTEHIRGLQNGSELDPRVLEAIQQELRRRMARRGLTSLPPVYLGYPDVADWDEVWEDLVHDCYLRAILLPLDTLKQYLRNGNDIDGVVLQNIDFFLDECQRRHDPVGRRLFKSLAGAIRDLTESGNLDVSSLTSKTVCNHSIARVSASVTAPPASPERLREAVMDASTWNQVAPGLGMGGATGRDSARLLIEQVLASGIRAFSFKDLFDAVIEDVRSARSGGLPLSQEQAIWASDGVEKNNWQWIRTIRPDKRYEDQENADAFVRKVRNAISALPKSAKAEIRLQSLFDRLLERSIADEEVIWADLARDMGIPKQTLSDDLHVLRSICERLRQGEPHS